MTTTDEILLKLGVTPAMEDPNLRERINVLLRRGCSEWYVEQLMREYLTEGESP